MVKMNIRIGIILSYLSIFAGIIVTIFYFPFMIESVGKAQHGIYSFVSSIISWASILTVGVAGAYVRFATKYKAEQGDEGVGKVNTGFATVLLWGAIIGIAFCLISLALLYFQVIPLTSYSNYEKKLIYQLFIIGIVHLPFSFLLIFFNAFNTYKNNFIIVRGIALLIIIINPIITLPFLLSGFNVISVSLVKFLVDVLALIAYFLLTFFSKRKLVFSKISNSNEKRQLIKEIIYFCVFIMIYITIDTINKSSDKIVLGFFGLPEMVSIYGLGRAFLEYAYLATVYISANYIQIINQKIVENKHHEVNGFFLRLSNEALLLMFFLFGGFFVSGKTFVNSWLANSVYSSNEINQIYWIALTLIFVHIVPFSQVSAIEIQRGYNKHVKPTIILLINALINVLLTIILIFILKKENAIWACLISTITTTFISQWIILNIYYKKELNLDVKTYFISFFKRLFITLSIVFLCYLILDYLIIIDSHFSGWFLFLAKGVSYTFLFFLFIIIFERSTFLFYVRKLKSIRKSKT